MKNRFRKFLIAAVKEATLPFFLAIYQKEIRMSEQLNQLQTTVDRLTQSVADTAVRVKSTQDGLQTVIDDLKNHPAAEDLSGPIDKLQAAITGLGQIDPPAAAAVDPTTTQA